MFSSPHWLIQTQEVPLAVPEPSASLTDTLARIIPRDVGHALSRRDARRIYSSNTTPRALSAATTASMSSTSQPICVWVREADPADLNNAKHQALLDECFGLKYVMLWSCSTAFKPGVE